MSVLEALPWPALGSLAFVAIVIACCIGTALGEGLRDALTRRRHQ
jgi:ABC-type dipeptide/oligopeptide/nickel transport system permease subunit